MSKKDQRPTVAQDSLVVPNRDGRLVASALMLPAVLLLLLAILVPIAALTRGSRGDEIRRLTREIEARGARPPASRDSRTSGSSSSVPGEKTTASRSEPGLLRV